MKIRTLLFFVVMSKVAVVASAQASSIVGTWTLTAADKLLPNGTRTSDYGDNPHGLVIFTADGYYSVQIYRSNRVAFSSGDKFNGTAEEYKDASLGMSVHFGRYTVDPVKNTITFQMDHASVANLDGITQVRSYVLKGYDLSWHVAARADGSIPMTVLRRVR